MADLQIARTLQVLADDEKGMQLAAGGVTCSPRFVLAIRWHGRPFMRHDRKPMDAYTVRAGCSVRPAETADIREIAALINTAFQVEKFFVDGDRITEKEVRQLIHSGRFLVVEGGEEDAEGIAACVYVECSSDRGYLGLLSVSPSRQREGLGRRLVAAAEEHARRSGCEFMDLLIVNLRTELPPFYTKLGYYETGASPFPANVPTKLPCHFIKMSKSLA